MRRSSKAAIILGALFLWYVLVGFLIAPLLLRHFGEQYLQENFSADSAIERIRMNPFTASIRVEGLFVGDPAGAWSAAWKEAELNASAASLIRFYPIVDAVRLSGADIRYERLPGGAAPVDTPERPPNSGEPTTWREQVEQLNLAEIPQIRVDLLEVSDGRFEFVDSTAATFYTETVDPINFTLRDLTTEINTEGDTEMRFLAETEAGGRLLWEGNFQSQPIRSSGSFSLSGIAVHDLAPYFAELIRFDLKRALYRLSFDYALDLSDLENLFYLRDGQMALTEVLGQPADAADQLISVESVALDGIDFRFPAMALEIGEIAVQDGLTRIVRDADGQINLMNLIAISDAEETIGTTAEPGPVASGGSLPTLSYAVGTFTLSDYRIIWEDGLGAEQANLSVDIPRLQLSGLSSDFEAPFKIDSAYIIGETGKANLSGTVVPAGPDLDLALEVEALPLEIFSAYAVAYGDVGIRGGTFDFEGRLQYAGEGSQALTGRATARNVSLTHNEQLDASWARLDLSGMRVELAPFSFGLDSLDLQKPVLAFTQSAGENPVAAADPGDAPEASADVPASVPLRIDSLRVSDGQFTFNDARMEPVSEIRLGALNLELTQLNLAGEQPADIAFSTEINGSRLTVNGAANVGRLKAATNLQISLEGLALSDFSAYSGQAVGRQIADGVFNLESDWQIEANQLKAANKIRIESFRLGDRVENESATRLPLDLAVTLLKGPNGVMDLSLPLSGDLSDPRVGLGQIIRTAFVGLITNVASAPFKMLAGLVGGEAEDLSFVVFDPGAAELSREMTRRLDKLATALKERPGIQLSMTPQISGDDLVQLSEEKLRFELMVGAESDDERIYRRRLTQRYREQMQAAGTPDRESSAENTEGLARMVAKLLPDVVLTDADRAALAEARAAAIRGHLVAAQDIAPERVVSGEPETGADGAQVVFELR